MKRVPAIEVNNLHVIYNEGTPNEVVAVDGVSFCAEFGQIIAVTGGNGSGKSTLLKAIAGFIPIKSGKILLYGQDVTNWPAHRRAKIIGFVHQDPMMGTCPNLTLHENFLISTDAWWLPLPYRLSLNKQQLGLISQVGLPLAEKAATPISMLSGGQRQAIALCLAFNINHSILLLDEFTSSLDEKTEKTVLEFIQNEAMRLNVVILMIIHDLDTANKIGTRRLNLKSGKLMT